MPQSETNYFVCTLGEAAQRGISRPFQDVNHLLHQQAEQIPTLPAIGFYLVTQNGDDTNIETKVLSFSDVQKGASAAGIILSKGLEASPGETLALLADSSPEFLFTWLGCIQLGHPVLLIAPQCSASAVAHLCESCQVHTLLVDEKHQDLATNASEAQSSEPHWQLKPVLMPFSAREVFSMVSEDAPKDEHEHHPEPDSIAYLHHTSGTSSGMPKPIPQTHHGAVGVLPALDGKSQATFTTTPLYHGGPADIFRAWTSHAMIWLFPSKDLPVTARNINRCLEAANVQAASEKTPFVKYFTSVPYILQIMAGDDEGLEHLRMMDLVGVGGAALPVEVGDRLVEQGVKLVSRFGAAECGFLLSSHRDYSNDRAWQYLRPSSEVKQLKFEPRDEGLYELVIGSDWPHMAKRNREDGSYATSDLFEKHDSIQSAWRYHSRADSQLTLITGKKFDPAPLEDALSAASNLLSDVLIFGNGQPYPGALLFRSNIAQDLPDSKMTEDLAPAVEAMNKENQSHARIPRNMLIIMPYEDSPLEKSSKGTILRNKAEEKYSKHIENAYGSVQLSGDQVADKDLPEALLELISSIIDDSQSTDLAAQSDLFAHGVDSVACVQIRHGLQPLVPKATKLPLTIVEDSRTVSGLTDFVLKARKGQASSSMIDQRQHILEFVNTYTKLDCDRPVETMTDGFTTIVEPPGKTVLMTGPTGSLGSHVLHQLLQNIHISHIYLLIRGATQKAARERVLKAFTSRKLETPDNFDQKVTILQCKLSEPDLGIPFLDYTTLQSEVDIVLHLAWSVNFLLSLQSFTPHFAGIQNLLNLCLSSTKRKPPRFVFCSSVASVSNFPHLKQNTGNVPEELVASLEASGTTGYALSKLTAELFLAHVATSISSLHDRITILRVGQLSADTQHGVWNASEAYPQVLASAKITDGLLPDLGSEEKLTWLPVDIAAKAFVEASMVEPTLVGDMPTEHVKHKIGEVRDTKETLVDGKGVDKQSTQIDKASVKILHLLNPNTEYNFTDFLSKLRRLLRTLDHKSSKIELATANQWLGKLESLQQDPDSNLDAQSLLRLLPFWKQAYSNRTPTSESSDKSEPELSFDMHNSLIAMPALTRWLGLSTAEGRKAVNSISVNSTEVAGEAKPGDDAEDESNELLKDDYVMKVWQWVQENVP